MIKVVKPVEGFLGLEIKRTGKKLGITQTSNIEKLVTDYGLQTCRTTFTPMELRLDLTNLNSKTANSDDTEFQKLLGSLTYLAYILSTDMPLFEPMIGETGFTFQTVDWPAAPVTLVYVNLGAVLPPPPPPAIRPDPNSVRAFTS